MSDHPNWDERYIKNDLPWDTGRHDASLEDTVSDYGIKPCATLEIGCGTGTNAIWLAEQGFDVTAIDVSPVAIERAQEKAAACDSSVNFSVLNIMADPKPVLDASFKFVFDRGCFHSFDDIAERKVYAELVWEHLDDQGLWLSLIGSTDGPDRELGPPRLSASEITSAVEHRFEILQMKSIFFDSDQEEPPRAWSCLMRKRA